MFFFNRICKIILSIKKLLFSKTTFIAPTPPFSNLHLLSLRVTRHGPAHENFSSSQARLSPFFTSASESERVKGKGGGAGDGGGGDVH
jgi:hypothetical protein